VKRKTAQENVEYVLDDRFVLQEASGSDSTHPSYRRYHYAGEPLAVADSGQSLRFLSVDALGSVSDLTTTSGTLYQARQYDAWGQYRNGTAPPANQPKLGYTGHQYDPETGLVYARARYYDAETGVFLSRDALERDALDAPWLHRYVWARGNPLRFFDPSGFDDEEIGPAPEMVPDEDESSLPAVEFSDQKNFEAKERRAEAQQAARDARLAGFQAENAVCARNPDAKGCRYEGLTVTESSDGPGTSQENDDSGVRELQQMREHRFDKVRVYAQTGQQVTDAAMTMLPAVGTAYDLKLTVDEAKAGNWKPALVRAGIMLAPGAVVAVAKVGGKWVAKLVKAEAAEAKVVAKEVAAVERTAAREAASGSTVFEDLARMRRELGLPAAGVEGDAATLAKLEINGKSFYGINAHGQEVSLTVNPISRTHAETDVFQQAANAGVSGGRGRLVVDRDLCTACGPKGAVHSMMRQLGIDELEVVTPSGTHVLHLAQ
jgi:RHS repeat-associated protein